LKTVLYSYPEGRYKMATSDSWLSVPDLAELVRLVQALGPLLAMLDYMADRLHEDGEVEYSLKKILKRVGKIAKVVLPIVGGGIAGGLIVKALTSSPSPSKASAPTGAVVVDPSTGESKVTGFNDPQEIWTRRQAAQIASRAYTVYQNSGPTRGLYYIFENFAPMMAVMEELKKLQGAGPAVDMMSYPAFYRSDGEFCTPCNNDPDFSGKLPVGTFYKSKLVKASLRNDLSKGVYGMVELHDSPFPISVSSNHGPARARIALAHEIGHVANRLYKLGLPHSKVHDLGVFYATEGAPALSALERKLGSRS
jgi:hypothetical protein